MAEVTQGGHCVVVRGRLDVSVDGAAMLDLAGTVILLDLAAPVPTEAVGTWVELLSNARTSRCTRTPSDRDAFDSTGTNDWRSTFGETNCSRP